MIELTDQQIEVMGAKGDDPPRAVNPHTHETYVLVPLDEYKRLAGVDYDDSGWTRDELHAQAWAAGISIGWEEIDY